VLLNIRFDARYLRRKGVGTLLPLPTDFTMLSSLSSRISPFSHAGNTVYCVPWRKSTVMEGKPEHAIHQCDQEPSYLYTALLLAYVYPFYSAGLSLLKNRAINKLSFTSTRTLTAQLVAARNTGQAGLRTRSKLKLISK
jgi:hypothetical protein